MSYTLRNLREVEDSAPKHGFGDIQEARFATGAVEAQDTGFAMFLVKPGRRQAFGHRHDAAEEVYVVLSGSGRAALDDEVVDLRERDALRVAPGVTRAFEAGPDGLELLAFGARHEGDGEIVPGWWPEG